MRITSKPKRVRDVERAIVHLVHRAKGKRMGKLLDYKTATNSTSK